MAPAATAERNVGPDAGFARKPLPENVATSPWEANAASRPPATVQAVPQTTAAWKFEKTAGCVYRGQRAVYLGPGKAFVDEEGHTFPRGLEVEVCTDTASKLSNPPYQASFHVIGPEARPVFSVAGSATAPGCDPSTGCC